ncbi:hypothetical protein ACGH2B_20975 [Streptomyces sp. BBFR2]|uniref:hypothetical protein n=1 Tax=Streptomyces sp. BBFR2 TaxID=3372854 RepID=UPI0037DA4BD2
MAKTIGGTGRVSVFPLLHNWPDTFGVTAYATTGHFGDTAVVGHLPLPGTPDAYLMDLAARHAAQPTEWVLCLGWSSRVVPKPGGLDLRDATWTLTVDGTSEPAKPVYGHSKLLVGRLTLTDPEAPDDSDDSVTYTRHLARKVLASRVGD